MPGKPAARIGDQTAHGGVITGPGCAMVLIEGKPACVMGDIHTCPMQTPGVPPIPHVGGPIIATAVLVMIGGKPAARLGDTAICTGPPATIIAGAPMVLIGDSGGGGGGGAGSGQEAKKKDASTAAVDAGESHKLDVKFVDKGGKPISGVEYSVKGPDGRTSKGKLVGQIKKMGVEEGNYDIEIKGIFDAKWSTESAKVGEKVKLSAKCEGIESGKEAIFEIFVRDNNFPDEPMTSITSKVDGKKIEAEWEMEVDDNYRAIQENKESQRGYSSPSFYFIVTAGGSKARSELLKFKDYIELKLKDKDGNAVADAEYKVTMPDGKIESGTLDSNGKTKIDNVPPGRVRVSYKPKKK